MSLDVYAGAFTAPTSTGTQDVTDPGFSAKLVLFFSVLRNSAGREARQLAGFGAFARPVSTTTQGAAGAIGSSGSSGDGRIHSSTKCGIWPSSASGTLRSFAWNATNANGFQLTHGTVEATAREIQYLALGGSDLENCKVVQHQSPTSTGNQSYTGAGFQPTAILAFGVGTASGNDTATAFGMLHFGASDGTTSYASTFLQNAGTTNKRGQINKLISQVNSVGATAFLEASLVSLNADGCTLNWSTVTASARYFYLVYLKGPQIKVVADTQKTSTGTKATTGVGFQPTALMLGTANHTSDAYDDGESYNCLGFTDGTRQNYGWSGCRYTTFSETARRYSDTNVIGACIPNTTVDKDAEAALSSLDSDGFTLDWTTADANARRFWALAIAGQAVAASAIGYRRFTGKLGRYQLVG